LSVTDTMPFVARLSPIVARAPSPSAGEEPAAIEGTPGRGSFALRISPVVQMLRVKAILAHTVRTEFISREDRALRTARAKLIGFTHAGPIFPGG